MSEVKKQHIWTSFLQFYGEQNNNRPTRLGVFEDGNDFWIEDGLPLKGIDVDTRGEMPAVEIMLGDNYTHVIKNATNIKINFSLDENNDGLDISDADGRTTILRFEK